MAEEKCQTCMPDRGPPVGRSSVRVLGAQTRGLERALPCALRQAEGRLMGACPSGAPRQIAGMSEISDYVWP